MLYTVKKLANLSGVTARTLRHYDEIDLLKPAFYGDNQYRYYGEKELLRLQQILFYRKLDFPLDEIKSIVHAEDFNKIKALQSHKAMLVKRLENIQILLKTIDKTISHLRGHYKMRIEEMFEGFDPVKQQEHEKYMLDTGIISQQQIDESWQRASHWKKPDWEQFKNAGEKINTTLAQALEQGQAVDSDEVQNLVQQHYDWINHFWTPTKETYLSLGQMYLEHADFRGFYNRFHPNLAEYLVAAMNVFAKHRLT